MDLVSVIIPTYNRSADVTEAVRSVLGQTYPEVEVLVVDDGSTDDTETALRPFAERVRYFKQERSGPAAARNRAMLQARGKYLAFLDADDLWLPDKLKRQVALLDARPEVVLSYTDYTRGFRDAAARGSQLRHYALKGSLRPFQDLFRENFIHTSTAMVRRDVLASTGVFDTDLSGSEDLDFWLRLARLGPFAYLDEVLTLVRRQGDNLSRTLNYFRGQVRATRLMLERWGAEEEVRPLIRQRLGRCYWDLAYAEMMQGNYRQARLAYWQSAHHGHRLAGGLSRAVFLSLPHRLLGLLRKPARRGAKPSIDGPID
jgi:glycosyltransferase involved in cell wall biosynthesis